MERHLEHGRNGVVCVFGVGSALCNWIGYSKLSLLGVTSSTKLSLGHNQSGEHGFVVGSEHGFGIKHKVVVSVGFKTWQHFLAWYVVQFHCKSFGVTNNRVLSA